MWGDGRGYRQIPKTLAAEQPDIPDKLFFRIGEVSHLVGVKEYVLRYWESEFPGLSPRKSSSGQRMFRRKDVELLLRIKHLPSTARSSHLRAREKRFSKKGSPRCLLVQRLRPNLFAANSVAGNSQTTFRNTPDAVVSLRTLVRASIYLRTHGPPLRFANTISTAISIRLRIPHQSHETVDHVYTGSVHAVNIAGGASQKVSRLCPCQGGAPMAAGRAT